ncbi:hypothetical protein C8Q73DRAFT_695487 [Cubamyces lactineus]|nr:hypothetical protein C8Q73DRAFT_695487 [Cubamyces lactineus]
MKETHRAHRLQHGELWRLPYRFVTRQQRTLKEEILQHEREAAFLSSRLNSRLPVSRLPPEILSEIFLFQAAIVREEQISRLEDLQTECASPFYGWTNVSQVCSSWRALALSLPSLWNWLAFDHRTESAYARLLVYRSRGLPLSCVLNATDQCGAHCPQCMSMDRFASNMHDARAQVNALLPRIRELSIYVDGNEPNDVWNNLYIPAPALEVLRIEAYGTSRFMEDDTHPAWVSVPSQIFDQDLPRIQSLSLSGVRFRLSSPFLGPSLRHLEIIACQCAPMNEESNLGRLLKALEQLPCLETLRLDWSIKARDGDSFPPVSLQRLKVLHVSLTMPSLLHAIISHLQIPPSATVFFSCPTLEYIDLQQMKFIDDIARRLLQGMAIVSVRCGSAWRDDEQCLVSRCHIYASQSMGDSETRVYHPQLLVDRLILESDHDDFVPSLLHSINLLAVQEIHFDDPDVTKEWFYALSSAKNVASIRTKGMFAMGLAAALTNGVPPVTGSESKIGLTLHTPFCTVLDQPASMNNYPPIFPRLTALTIEDVHVGPASSADAERYWRDIAPSMMMEISESSGLMHDCGFSVANMLKCLEIRRSQGAQDITQVYFKGCTCEDMAQLAPLVQAVETVRWDGRTLRAEEYDLMDLSNNRAQ